jgi:hypothetical protein
MILTAVVGSFGEIQQDNYVLNRFSPAEPRSSRISSNQPFRINPNRRLLFFGASAHCFPLSGRSRTVSS